MTAAIRNGTHVSHLPASWLKEPADGDITEFKTEHGYTQRASAKHGITQGRVSQIISPRTNKQSPTRNARTVYLSSNPATAADLLDVATKQKPSGGKNQYTESLFNNVNEASDRPDGNSKHAGLRRLRKDRPDLDLAEADGTVSDYTVRESVKATARNLAVDLPQTVRGKEARP